MELKIPSRSLNGDLFQNEEIVNLPRRVLDLNHSPPSHLIPTLLIQYARYRFVDPTTSSRIAVDTKIICADANPDCFLGSTPKQLQIGVLEVKGERRDLPASLAPLHDRLVREAFSKYARCCEGMAQPLGRRM